MSRFRKNWFLIALLLTLSLGVFFGYLFPQSISWLDQSLDTGWIVALVLFCMSITLKVDQLQNAFRKPGPVIWALSLNTILLPTVAWCTIFMQPLEELSIGLLATMVVPTTMASAAVWTRKAGGNDAIPMINTLLTNGLCFLIAPSLLIVLIGQSVDLSFGEMAVRLILVAFIPMAGGQLIRSFQVIANFADDHRQAFGLIAQLGILSIILTGAIRSGPELMNLEASSLWAFCILIAQCLMIHSVVLLVGFKGAIWMNMTHADAIGCMLSGSQKTLTIALDITALLTLTLGTPLAGLMILPPMIYHAIQLIVDTFVIDLVKSQAQKIELHSGSSSPPMTSDESESCEF